jgi:hypothetical protein
VSGPHGFAVRNTRLRQEASPGLKYKPVEALAKAEASFVCALLFTHGKAALRTRFTPTLLRPPHPTPRP